MLTEMSTAYIKQCCMVLWYPHDKHVGSSVNHLNPKICWWSLVDEKAESITNEFL